MKLSIKVRNVTRDPRAFGIYGYKPNPNREVRFKGFRSFDLTAAPLERVIGIESDRAILPGEIVILSRRASDAAYGLEWYVRKDGHRCFEVQTFTLGTLSLIDAPGLLGAPPVD